MRKIFTLILIFIFSCSVGFYYATLWKKNNISLTTNEIEEDNTTIKTSFEEEKILYSTKMAVKKYYNECGHVSINYIELPNELINLNKKELAKIYDSWNIEKFDKDEIIISQNIDKICNDHYVLKLYDDKVGIFKQIESDDLKFFKDTNISLEYLTEDDIKKLEEGIYVFGIRMLNSALEDFE